MVTSLARQLAALRTPASSAPTAQATAYSGPFLFPEANQDNCDLSTLKENAEESISRLIDMDVVFSRFTRFLFEDILDARLESEIIEELLFLLSPYTLLRPAQWVLQFLVTKYKVNYKYPELFFFCVLPFYEFEIYAKAVDAIDTVPGGTDYPNWFLKFKQACVPTTKLALYRHTAAERGFIKLLCDMVLRLSKMTVTYPEIRLQRQASMFVMTILGALENRQQVEEEQAMYILQVILNCMKSCHPELVAMSQILLSYVLSRVAFKEKAVLKITKSLRKCMKKSASMENMMLLILMVRTQANMDVDKARKMMVSLEPVINFGLNASAEDEDTASNLDSILYTVALLIQPLVPEEDGQLTVSTAELNQMLGYAASIIKKVPVSTDTVEYVGDTAYRLLKAISRTSVEDMVDSGLVDATKSAVEKILNLIHTSYPAQYQRIHVDTDDVDVFFLGGQSVEKRPKESQVAAKKALLNNTLINFLMKNFVSNQVHEGMLKLLKRNKKSIDDVLEAETNFLMEQMEVDELEKLLVNLLVTKKKKELGSVINHLCSQIFVEKIENKFRLELLLAPFFVKEELAELKALIVKSYFGKQSTFLSSLPLISDENPDKQSAIIEKLMLYVNPSSVNTFLIDPVIPTQRQATMMFLAAIELKLRQEEMMVDKPKLVNLISRLVGSGALLVENEAESESKSKKKKKKIQPSTEKLFLKLLENTKVMSEFSSSMFLMESLPRLLEKDRKLFVDAIEDMIKASKGTESEHLKFYLHVSMKSSCLKTRYLCLQRLGTLLNTESYVQAMLNSGPTTNNSLLAMLLTQIFHVNDKIRRVTFALLRVLGKQCKEEKLKPVFKFLLVHKSEIISQSENLQPLISKSAIPDETLKILLDQMISSSVPCFEVLVDFIAPLKSKEAVSSIAEFGKKLLKDQSQDSIGAIKAIIDKFTKKIIKQMDSDACFDFFSSCAYVNSTITVAGLETKLSSILLDKATSPKLWASTESGVVEKLISHTVEMSGDSTNVKMIPLLHLLNISVEMLINQLNSVWGKGNLVTGGRGGYTEQTPGSEAELLIWGKTVFLLELMDGYILKEDRKDLHWEKLVQPVFAVLRKLSDDDVLESSYKLNLVLTVLMKLFTAAPDSKIKLLSNKDLEPELLTYCIRRSSNPESRQLALKVLARCAVTIPQYVLQNSMTIFTFMGTHLLKMDSKHSYKIACDAIDVIVPALKSTCESKAELQKTSLDILNNFIHMEEDVPEHRYSEFVYRLINALDSNSYLWIAMLLSVKSTFKAKHRQHKTNLIHRRLTDLILRFSVEDGLKGIIGVFVNLRSDDPQLRRIFGCPVDRKDDKVDEWDVLRLGALIMLNKIIPSCSFSQRIGKHLLHDEEIMKDLLHLLLESSILTLESFESLPDDMPNKLKSSIVTQGEKTLELVLSLMPYNLYVSVVGVLLGSKNSTLRRRAMEVVSGKLEQVEVEESGDVSHLLPILLDLAVKETIPQNQQIALLSIRQTSRKIRDTVQLTAALETLNTDFLGSLASPEVLGTAILTMTDLLMAAGVSGVPYLENIVTWMITSLEKLPKSNWDEKNSKVVYSSLLLGLQKILEKFGGFMNPYLDQLIILACRLYNHPQASIRARGLWTSVHEQVSPHVLLPRSRNLLIQLWDEPDSVSKFASLLGLNLVTLERSKLNAVSRQLVDIYTFALTYRTKQGNSEEVEETESEIISAFLSVALKMSLEDFQPIFQQVVNKQKLGDPNTLTTMFNFVEKIGARLKGLFGFSVEFVLSESTSVLSSVSSKQSSLHLITAILRCLTRVLNYNKVNTINLEKYENLVSALLSVYKMDSEVHQDAEDAIASLADSTEDDAMWKHLNFTVLMNLRAAETEVRGRMIQLIRRFVTSRRDTYMVVLPDAVPFLSEALEDDDQEIEEQCKELIKHMETTFGQNIEAYFA